MNDIPIKLCIVQKKTDNPTQINAVVMPAKNLFCRNERKEKAQKSLRSHWAVRILFWRSFYSCNCATGRIEPFSCIPKIIQRTSDCLEWNAAV